MRQRNGVVSMIGALLAVTLAACAGSSPPLDDPTFIPLPSTATPTPLPQALTSSRSAAPVSPPEPAQQNTPDPLLVRIWWPDELYPPSGSTAEIILTSQFESFRQTYATSSLDVRRKRSSGVGGIMPSLRSAERVAPGALPDLALMRRSDMITAAAEDLIIPMNDWVPADILDNLLPGVRALGEVDGVLYGIPYALNVYHVIYRHTMFDAPLLTFDDVLDHEPHYLFPASSGPGALINWTVLLQYLEAGGRLVDSAGNPVLDREPLIAVLDYYEQGVTQGIFDAALLGYNQFDVYWNDVVTAEAHLAGVDSITYLSRKTSVQNIGLAPIPTLDGEPITALDGWLWVLTTRDPDRQRQARGFLSWMMRVSQQAEFTEAFGILPSQQRALRLWEDEAYAQFAQDLIDSARVIPSAQRNNSAAAALQEGLVAVLQGTSAQAAADAAIARLTE